MEKHSILAVLPYQLECLSAATHTLLDQCAFEQINICGMIQYDEDDADWVQTLSSTDVKDHTLAGNCRGHFS